MKCAAVAACADLSGNLELVGGIRGASLDVRRTGGRGVTGDAVQSGAQMHQMAAVLYIFAVAGAAQRLIVQPQILRVRAMAADALDAGRGMGGSFPVGEGLGMAIAADRGVNAEDHVAVFRVAFHQRPMAGFAGDTSVLKASGSRAKIGGVTGQA